jgi:hypothetical protein
MARYVVPVVVVLLAMIGGYVIGQYFPWRHQWIVVLYEQVSAFAGRTSAIVFFIAGILLFRHANRLTERKGVRLSNRVGETPAA